MMGEDTFHHAFLVHVARRLARSSPIPPPFSPASTLPCLPFPCVLRGPRLPRPIPPSLDPDLPLPSRSFFDLSRSFVGALCSLPRSLSGQGPGDGTNGRSSTDVRLLPSATRFARDGGRRRVRVAMQRTWKGADGCLAGPGRPPAAEGDLPDARARERGRGPDGPDETHAVVVCECGTNGARG